jgi:hypothetical protein
LGGVLLVTAFPELLSGPLGDVDPLYERVRLRNINELRPLVDGTTLVTGLGLVPFVVAAVIDLWRDRVDVFARQLHLLAVPAAIYLPLAVWQVRWLFALNLVLVVPAALNVQRFMHAAAPKAQRVHLGMMAVAAGAALWWLPLLPAVKEPSPPRCDIDTAIAALNDAAGPGREPLRLMAMTDYGPEILFRTPHSVQSIPNHRHQPGFTASYSAMTATAPETARRIVDRSGIDAVLVCTDVVERSFYGAAPDSFHTQLADGDAPTWLREIPLRAAAPRFRLYRVDRSGSGQASARLSTVPASAG